MLRCPLEPLHGLVLQGLVIAKGYACRATTSAADTFFRLNIYGTLLVYNGVYSANRFSITRLAVVFTNNVQHYYSLLRLTNFYSVVAFIGLKSPKSPRPPKTC
jgi:hypothetical protein